jgi:hypothetical protein
MNIFGLEVDTWSGRIHFLLFFINFIISKPIKCLLDIACVNAVRSLFFFFEKTLSFAFIMRAFT